MTSADRAALLARLDNLANGKVTLSLPTIASDSAQAIRSLEAERDALHGAAARAESWINSVPHKDNCFVLGGPTDACRCGRSSLLEIIHAALAARSKT